MAAALVLLLCRTIATRPVSRLSFARLLQGSQRSRVPTRSLADQHAAPEQTKSCLFDGTWERRCACD